MFGTYPLNVSVSSTGAAANGNSSSPAVSGDNRKTRFAAFQSDASNLVAGDTNNATDIFRWSRPSGSEGLRLPAGSGSLALVSVPDSGGLANGASRSPSLDGSVQKGSHCVAFESDASNMAPGDADTTTDVFVRDLSAGKTYLVSRGISAPAGDADIDGACKNVAFASSGSVFIAGVKSGAVKRVGPGSDPDYALDGRAIAWDQGPNVAFMRDGKKTVVGPGSNPTVTDAERLHNMTVPNWGVSFDTPAKLSSADHNDGIDTYLKVFGPKGGAKRTDLITFAQPQVDFAPAGDNYNGGITAYGTNRGILTYVHADKTATDAYYWNQHTGNADDIAHAATSADGTPGITEMVTSARANFVAFTSPFAGDQSVPFTGQIGRDRGSKLPGGLSLPKTLDQLFSPFTNVYFKMLVDGEAA